MSRLSAAAIPAVPENLNALPYGVVADLHAHTTASDGELTPEDLVSAAAKAGLQVLAVTDHDTLAGVARAQAKGRELGVEVIAGCELTASAGEIELHILAYFVDASSGTPFAKLLDDVCARRKARVFEMAERLSAAGLAISKEELVAAANGATAFGQPHVARVLARKGFAPDAQSAIRKFLRRGCVGYAPKQRLTPEEVFEAVHAAGGICSLAHPGAQKHDELIAPLFARGMDAVEVSHPSHSEVDRRFYAALARRYERGVTAGSDFHGPELKPGVLLGMRGVSAGTLEDLRNRAARRQAEAKAV